MKIYDFETFGKHYKNTKAIKFKDFAKLSNCTYYSKDFFCWGKKFKATYSNDIFEIITIKIYTGDSSIISYDVTFDEFIDVIEYIEVKDSLEIE